MPEFIVYKFNDEEAYRNAMKLKDDIYFTNKDSNEYLDREGELEEMLNYAPVKKKFQSWDEVSEYLRENEYTSFEELGDLEEREICSKCGAKMYTNSQDRLNEQIEAHQVQLCPEERRV